MTIYAYRCRTCGAQEDQEFEFGTQPKEYPCGHIVARRRTQEDGDWDFEECPGMMRRDYSSVVTHRPMPTHFNHTVMKEIGSMKQMSEALKVESENYYLRTGIEAKFVPHDPNDAKALNVTGDGLDSTNRARVAAGKRAIEPKL